MFYFSESGQIPDSAAVAQSADVPRLEQPEWLLPWIFLVLLNSLQLVLLPRTSVLEGCGQLQTINRFRFWQSVLASFAVWATLSLGFGLWTLAASALVRVLGEGYVSLYFYRSFFSSIHQSQGDAEIDWQAEVLPLQWRIAVQGVLHWFATHLAGLVLFHFHGEIIGGQFGLMWTILTAIQGASMTWVDTRRPEFGRLIAQHDYCQLDRLFFRAAGISMLLLTAGGSMFVTGVWVLNEASGEVLQRIAARLPELKAVCLFTLAFVALQPALCVNIYVRAFKRDPFLIPAIISSVSVALLVVVMGRSYSVAGAGTGYLIGIGLIQTPLWLTVWARLRSARQVESEIQ
ncbi:MAG: hypothetical protein R3C49_05855 [Planctomycetaceae bacterium]